MGKNKHNKPTNRAPQSQASPAPVSVKPSAPASEPTPEQTIQIEALTAGVEQLNVEHGPASSEGVNEPAGATLAASLQRVEVLLKDARAHYERARAREAAAKAEDDRLAALRRAQDEEREKQRRAAEGKLAAAKREQDDRDLALMQREDACDAREKAAQAADAKSRAEEARLLEQAARLAEREINAEQGFLLEKARILKPLDEVVARLRRERDQIEAELTERRERAETEARAKTEVRMEAWAKEDADRSSRQDKERRAFNESLAKERQEALAKLRDELNAERARAEAKWQIDLDARRAELEASAERLKKEGEELAQKARELRRGQQDLKTDEEMLADEKDANARKVERLVAERTEGIRHDADALRKQLEDARSTRDAYFKELESRREIDGRRYGDRAPEQLLLDLEALEAERDRLADELRRRPDARAAERLAELERERSAWLEERAVLQGDLAKANGELSTRRLSAIELEALRKQKEALEVHKQLLDGAVDELRARVEELTRQDDRRNPMTALTSLDESEELQRKARTTQPLSSAMPTLEEFAEDLKHRIAKGIDGRTLYYADRDVRAFLGGLAMTRLMLLQGISGTGKTSLPVAFANAVGGRAEVIEVQAGWRDRQDLVGYYNAFHRHYYATNFLQALYKAGTPAYKDRLFLIVLDEINLSRPEQFFADFLSALELPEEARRLTLVNDPVQGAPRLMVEGRHLPIPPNVWFVGTANHDETTAEFADKTYDRAHVMEMPRKTEAAHFNVEPKGIRAPISHEALKDAFDTAARAQADTIKHATEWLQKAPFADMLAKQFRVGWGNRLEHQLARYLPVVVEAGGSVGEAMDHLLETKVFRRLKDRHDVRKGALEKLHEQLLEAWETLDKANQPARCEELLAKEVEAKNNEVDE